MTNYVEENLRIKFEEKKKKLLWMKHFEFVGVVPESANRKIYVKCAFSDELQCKKQLKYLIADATTTNLKNHLKVIHKYVDNDESSKNKGGKGMDGKVALPFNAYDPGYIDTTRGIIYMIVKDKMSLNSVNAEGFRYSLKKSKPR